MNLSTPYHKLRALEQEGSIVLILKKGETETEKCGSKPEATLTDLVMIECKPITGNPK